MAKLREDLTRAKQEYDNQQSERTRIAYVLLSVNELQELTDGRLHRLCS
jgi:hypothetical protein